MKTGIKSLLRNRGVVVIGGILLYLTLMAGVIKVAHANEYPPGRMVCPPGIDTCAFCLELQKDRHLCYHMPLGIKDKGHIDAAPAVIIDISDTETTKQVKKWM